MTQLVPATCVLGPGMTGLTIGLRVLNLDGTEYAAFSTTGVAETSTAGTYRKVGGVVAPLAGGYIVWGTALVDYAEATVESTSANVTYSAGVALTGRLAEAADIPAAVDVSALALEATAQAILLDTGTTLPAAIAVIDSNVDLLLAADTSTSDATTAGAISRRRGNSWAIPLTIGAITGYTSLWFTIKSSYDDADTSALVQVKLNSPSALDGLLYVNGTTASSAALGSITVSDAATGEIVVNVDEAITDDLAPGTYYYDVQTLISGNVATPDSGVFTVTADVTRSVT